MTLQFSYSISGIFSKNVAREIETLISNNVHSLCFHIYAEHDVFAMWN
jgi:hypothetical protein